MSIHRKINNRTSAELEISYETTNGNGNRRDQVAPGRNISIVHRKNTDLTITAEAATEPVYFTLKDGPEKPESDIEVGHPD